MFRTPPASVSYFPAWIHAILGAALWLPPAVGGVVAGALAPTPVRAGVFVATTVLLVLVSGLFGISRAAAMPTPVATLVLEHLAHRRNMNTATNRESRWLFPGRRAGQPIHPRSLSALINALGIPATAGRAAAIRQHVLDMPAPVVASAFGYHHVTTTRLAAEAGTTWSSYAGGDHRR
jgi:hypothetical protein